ncbi:glycosyltransferase [Erwinia tracheiphila]|uniref:Colanic acid biosynthesis glycosyltransferase WcaL n=1 Tax=Erwinia tracheiphila TaxID=65700 RepID=A0A0M2K6S6_9GAMM|nr:glycosyltransferase [Erwinia tracheiphila]EOS96434.1 colanic acid biosynthesis glycosyltransferase WcaL [Erwinia tracheiphila PSU-1]KKF35115.1 colanic acid biosynthesis glycosyltransferase WcaL [Erwinia tracheiphila]UIA86772.1 glycosyltransferase [Erwinia tracheiphila]UIA95128.1 glycosyltransferase [Erwinia tracheiphila]
MKITFFTMRFPVSSETFVLNQVTYFIDQGYDVEVISVFPGDLTHRHGAFDRYNLAEKTHYLLPEDKSSGTDKLKQRLQILLPKLLNPCTMRSLNVKRYGQQSSKLLLPAIVVRNEKHFNADLFLVHFGYAGVLANKLRELGVLHGRQATVFHSVDISRRHILDEHKVDYLNLFSQTDLLLPISHRWENKLIAMGYLPEKIQVSRMGIEPEKFNFQPREGLHSPLRILSVARLTEKKGLGVAVEACRYLKALGASFEYTIIGNGDMEETLREAIRAADLEDCISMVGFKPQEEIKGYLHQTDIFLLPSLTAADGDMEGIPVALMEAMAVGLPVVSSEHSGLPELIEHNVSGWLAPEGDGRGLGELLLKLANSEMDIQPVVAAARKKVETEFNQHIAWRELATLLEEFA